MSSCTSSRVRRVREAERNEPQLTLVELTVELATERAASHGIDNTEIHKSTLHQSVQTSNCRIKTARVCIQPTMNADACRVENFSARVLGRVQSAQSYLSEETSFVMAASTRS